MTMRSLSRVRARVDRLPAQSGSGAGCPVCREDEARVRLRHHTLDDSPSYTADELPAASQTCTACGRTYALRRLVIWHEQP